MASMTDIFGRGVARGIGSGAKGYVRNMALYNDESPVAPDTMEFWFRPSTVNQTIMPEYGSAAPIGMSHPYRTYTTTSAFSYRFEIFWNSLMMLKEIGRERRDVGAVGAESFREGAADDLAIVADMIEQDRRFLEALTLPRQGGDGLVGSSPPVCLLVIPGIVTMRCFLSSLSFDFEQSDIRGLHKQVRAITVWEEAPLQRITMEDQLTTGSFRLWG